MKGSCTVITFMVPQFQTIKWNYAVNLFKVWCNIQRALGSLKEFATRNKSNSHYVYFN